MDVGHLRAVTIEQLTPTEGLDRPAVAWPAEDRDLEALWHLYGKKGDAAVVAAGVSVLQQHVRAELKVTSAMAASVSGTEYQLAGLEFRLKSPRSLVRKLADRARGIAWDRQEVDVAAIAAKLTDVLRYTVETPDQDSITAALRTTVERLHASGMRVVEIDNKYHEGNAYKGVHLLVETSEEVTVELQIHSSEGLAVKEQAHAYYERARDTRRPFADRQADVRASKDLYARLPTPRGLDEITEVDGVKIRKA